MSNNVIFTCNRLTNTNKVGNIKVNPDGSRTMIVGALNMFNSANMYYPYEAAKDFFLDTSGEFMRRVSRGVLMAENGHPRMLPGMSEAAYFARLHQIHEDRVCAYHSKITLDFDNYRDEKGRPIVAILSDVMVSGELGYILERSFQNPNENICFSIRSFTKDYMDRGVINRAIKKIITFDRVVEPGMSIAEKFFSPSLESMEDHVFSRGTAEAGLRHMVTQKATVGMESAVLTASDLFSVMGWDPAAATSAMGKLKDSAWKGW